MPLIEACAGQRRRRRYRYRPMRCEIQRAPA